MFIFHLTYLKEISEVEKFLPAHRQYLERYYEKEKFICSGRKEPRTGGIILCDCADSAEAQKILAQDPFFQNGIAQYEVLEFFPSKYSKTFASCVRQ